MTQYFSVPVAINLIVSLCSSISGRHQNIGITADFDISGIIWNIEGILPSSINITDNGKSIVLVYKRKIINTYNLRIGSVQRMYVGSNIIEYLQTADSFFGSYNIVTTSSQDTTVAFAAAFLLGVVGILAINDQ